MPIFEISLIILAIKTSYNLPQSGPEIEIALPPITGMTWLCKIMLNPYI
jgi:hypothetical protein